MGTGGRPGARVAAQDESADHALRPGARNSQTIGGFGIMQLVVSERWFALVKILDALGRRPRVEDDDVPIDQPVEEPA